MKIWGVDPGVSGALALVDTDGMSVSLHEMPTLTVKKKREVSPFLLSDIFASEPNAPVVLDAVHAMPGQGVTSMFNFGKSYGCILGVVAGMSMRIQTVTPSKWKKDMSVPAGKDGARARAMELFPSASEYFARKKDDGKAEASIIAMWGLKFGAEEL